MKTAEKLIHVLTMTAVLVCVTSVALGDMPAPPKGPPVEKTLTGVLNWEMYKKADGTEHKGTLVLKTGTDAKVLLGGISRNDGKLSPAMPAGVDVEQFVGKQVTVSVMAYELTGKGGKTGIQVTKIIGLKEAATPQK
jgi:hypothetical protein